MLMLESTAITGTSVPAVKLPTRSQHYIGRQTGTPAPGARVSVDIEMDTSQRDYNERDVVKYIEEVGCVDWNLFGYVTVVEYPDGRQVLINGQHRTGVVKTLLPNIKEVPAHIIKTNDPRYAAITFARYNGIVSRQVSKEQLLWAEVLAESPDALQTKYWLERCGVSCGKVNDSATVEVKRATFEKALKFSPECTEYAIQLIRAAWPKATSFDNLLLGVVRLLSHKSYNKLTNTNLTIGREFAKFMVEYARTNTVKDATLIVPRSDPWYDSVAYGIYKKFRVYMANQNKLNHCPSQDILKNIYKGNDQDD